MFGALALMEQEKEVEDRLTTIYGQWNVMLYNEYESSSRAALIDEVIHVYVGSN